MDGSLAILLTALDGEPLAKATVCLVDYGYTPPPNCIAVKNYSENEGMLASLLAAGMIEAPTEEIKADLVVFPICKLTQAAVEAAIADRVPASRFAKVEA